MREGGGGGEKGEIVDSVSCDKFSDIGGGAISDLRFRYNSNTFVVKFSR